MNRRLRSEAADVLQSTGAATVITDVAGRRDVLHATLTAKKVLVRFVGNEMHPTDLIRLQGWQERLASWIDRGMEEIHFFIHQPTQAEVPELARRLIHDLNARCGLTLRCWTPVPAPTPRAEPQLSLF